MTLRYGFHASPFGTAIVIASGRGLAGLAFADPGEEHAAFADMKRRWPKRHLCRGPRRHRRPRATHLRYEALAAGPAAARGADRHGLRGAGLGDAAEDPDGPRGHAIPTSPTRSKTRRPRAPSAPRSARTRSHSWCPAIACSARAARSPAITGASRANRRCSAGKPGRWECNNSPSDHSQSERLASRQLIRAYSAVAFSTSACS